ncbi:hypothetical protein BH09ACT12_BH09ACT12_01230 [soil metagenome]
MYNFDRMIVQAEMDYRGEKLRRGISLKRRNRFVELHHQRFTGAPEVAKRAR